MKKIIHNSLIGALALLAVSGVQAASVVINPDTINVVTGGATFTATVDGTGFATGIDGAASGGFKLSWDDTVFNLISTPTFSSAIIGIIDNPFPAFDGIAGITVGAGSIDVFFSSCTPDNVGNCPTLSGTFTVLDNLTFQLDPNFIGETTATLGLTAVATNWFDGASNIITPLDFGTATINVSAVPVPAAAWLFGSGLLGMVGIARRKTQLA